MTRRRKLTRKNANGRITPWLLEKLASGYEYSFLAGEVPLEDLKDAWLENRDWLLERHIQAFPGTRPWAWWRFDAPESRKNATVGEEWRDFFGLPYKIDFQQEPAIFETEAEYLKRIGLLEKGEIPGRYATNLFLCSDQFSPKVTEFTAADRVAIERGCYFDRREAYRVWRFLTRYIKLSHGDWAGKPFVPQAWQWRNILGPMFGWWTSDGLRRFRRSFIFIPKKNGKSTLCSALVLYFLNDGEGSAEVYSVATAVDQAKIIYRETMKMVRKSPDLSSASRIIDSRKIIEQGDCFYRALSGDSASSEGLNIHALIVDELHAWNTPTLTELWNSLKYGGAARKQPMQVVITTAGEADEDALWYEEYAQAKGVVNGTDTDIHLLPFIAEAGEDDPWDEPATWAKANPSFGVVIKEEEMTAQCEDARGSERKKRNFMRYRLNRPVSLVVSWLNMDEWHLCNGKPEHVEGMRYWAGLDLSSNDDLTAMVHVGRLDSESPVFYVWPEFFLPEETILQQLREGKQQYEIWRRNGYLTATPGSAIDLSFIERRVLDVHRERKIEELVYDPWHATGTSQRMEAAGITCVEFRQGMRNFAEPTKQLELLIKTKRILHGGHPVLTWNVAHTEVRVDENLNMRPIKCKDKTKKIDGTVALIMALSRAMDAENTEFIYETRGMRIL